MPEEQVWSQYRNGQASGPAPARCPGSQGAAGAQRGRGWGWVRGGSPQPGRSAWLLGGQVLRSGLCPATRPPSPGAVGARAHPAEPGGGGREKGTLLPARSSLLRFFGPAPWCSHSRHLAPSAAARPPQAPGLPGRDRLLRKPRVGGGGHVACQAGISEILGSASQPGPWLAAGGSCEPWTSVVPPPPRGGGTEQAHPRLTSPPRGSGDHSEPSAGATEGHLWICRLLEAHSDSHVRG